MADDRAAGDHGAMHADILITIVFGAFVAFTALATVFAILRTRLRARAAQPDETEQLIAPGR